MQKKKTVLAEKILGRSLPFSVEAERAVLGGLLLNDEYLDRVQEIIKPPDFYNQANRTVFEAMIALCSEKQRIDMVTLQDELEKKGTLEQVGGLVFLLSLQEDIPAVGLIEQHATIIKEKAILRELISSATHIITNCYSQNNQPIANVLDEAEKTIFQISQRRSQNSFI